MLELNALLCSRYFFEENYFEGSPFSVIVLNSASTVLLASFVLSSPFVASMYICMFPPEQRRCYMFSTTSADVATPIYWRAERMVIPELNE